MSGSSGEPVPAMPDIDGWLVTLSEALPADVVDEIGIEERAALLDLARIAAHRSHRSAAPITTYAIGLTVAGSSPGSRLARLRELARTLDRP